MFTIKVPATTANLGTGFDSLGIAFELFNTFSIEKVSAENTEIIWICPRIVEDEDNLTLRVIHHILAENHGPTHFKFWVESCDIPIGKGLGSSAASIVAGCLAANYLLDFKYSVEELMIFALRFEPHPDNLAPAFMGGMILSSPSELTNSTIYTPINLASDLNFYAFIPTFSQSTDASRGLLPTEISLVEHIKNSSRACCLINAINQRQYQHLRHAMTDTIHQPLRLSTIPDADKIFALSKSCGALSEFLSGSGPTLISVVHASHSEEFQTKVYKQMPLVAPEWNVMPLRVNHRGAQIDSVTPQSMA